MKIMTTIPGSGWLKNNQLLSATNDEALDFV